MSHPLKAVIFDLDGVISDTQKIKTQVSVDLLYEKYGIEITPEDYEERYAGMKTRHIFTDIFQRFQIEDDMNRFIEDRIGVIDSHVADEVPLIRGSLDLIQKCKQQGLKIAVASGGMRYWVDLILKKLDLKNKFDVIAYSDEVEHAKPDPEIYLLAAEKLRLDPKECLVIEDAYNGMLSAKSAGMFCIGLVDNTNETEYPADILVATLDGLDVTQAWQSAKIQA